MSEKEHEKQLESEKEALLQDGFKEIMEASFDLSLIHI